jgi:hypothetical protein
MEAYTLWWNGGTFQELLDYNTKDRHIGQPSVIIGQGRLDMERQT